MLSILFKTPIKSTKKLKNNKQAVSIFISLSVEELKRRTPRER